MNWLSTKRISSSNKQQQRRCREPRAVSAAQRMQREPQNRGSPAAMEALTVVTMLNCNINRQQANVWCDTRASDASRDVKWTGKCKAECSRLRPNQKPTPGLWTAADFAVTLTTNVGKIAFARREAVHSTNDHWPTSKA